MANWKKGFTEIRIDAPKKTRRTISACLIVKNEEEKLGRCLTSLLGAVDEIVVVDTGSTDRTIDVARKYGARVGHFAWIGDFSAARNAALDLAVGDWILSIDADEWLANDESRAFVRREVQTAGNVAFVPNIRLPNGYEYWGSTRLFPREGSRWEYRIHEQVRLPRADTMGLFDRDFFMYHDGYEEDIRSGKESRNAALLQAMRDAAAPGSRESKHAQIYLARSRKDPLSPEDAAEIEEALKVATGFDEGSAQLLTFRLYRHFLETAAFDEIDRVNNIAWALGARGPLNHYAQAVLRFEEGDKKKAAMALAEAERANDLAYARVALRRLFVDLRRMIGEMPD